MEKLMKKEVFMNKKEFGEKLKNKQFEECIEILRTELIEIITEKIKEKDSYFHYTTTKDLYNKSKKVLEQKYSKIAYELYCFDIMPEKEEYVLDVMFQMYKELK